MKTSQRKTGDLGEELTCQYLIRKGYRIIERNYLMKYGEIDIIAKKDKEIVFIEVKTSKKGSLIAPEENMTWRKIGKFHRIVELYRSSYMEEQQKWRMDAIFVLLDPYGNDNEITHLENINIQ
ncbi:MAG: YraN family protein [Patescibacteria group bacterium]